MGEQGEMQLSDLCGCVCVCAPKFALRRQFPSKFKTARVEDCIHRRENERATERERESKSESGRVREHNSMSINGKVVHTLKMQKQNCLRERRRVPLPLHTNVAPRPHKNNNHISN